MIIKRRKTKIDNKCEYTCKSDGKVRKFKPMPNALVATFDTSVSETAAASLWNRDDSSIDALSLDRGFAVLRTTDVSNTIDDLDVQEQFANTLPAMQDEDGGCRYFMPDELTVQFNDDVSRSQSEQCLQAFDMPIIQRQRTAGYFTVGVPEDKGLFESIEAIASHQHVAFAEPSEVELNSLLQTTKTDNPDRNDTEQTNDADDNGTVNINDWIPNLDAIAEQETSFLNQERLPDSLFTDCDIVDELIPFQSNDLQALPRDQHFKKLWGLHNLGQTVDGTNGLRDADIDAPAAWTMETGSRNVIVAVIDTGCDLDHPDLKSNILPRGNEDWDFADDNDKEPWDSGSHGTHVAGTAAAARNSAGVLGVAYKCRIMPLRINLTAGMNQNRADAINYVTSQAIKYTHSRHYVINCSWRMSGNHTAVRTAIQKAAANNIVVVFAAGNANRNIDNQPQYPAVYPEVIAVAATDQRDQRAGFSNYGKKVDVAAPGVNTYSTVPDNSYGFKDGTSMAAPHVAGLAALLWSKNMALTAAQVRHCIESSCDNIDARNPGFVGQLGKGRINAYRALRHCTSPTIRTKHFKTFSFPQQNSGSSSGLSFVPGYPLRFLGQKPTLLFLTQQAGSERIYFMDSLSGQVRGSIDPENNNTIGSLAWDGQAIRVANVTTGKGYINRINLSNGQQTGSIPAPSGRGEGMVVAHNRIFYSTISHIHEIYIPTGRVLRSYPAPGGECRGLAYGKGYLFSANSVTGEVTVFHPRTKIVKGIVKAPGNGSRRCEGIAFDERRRILYIASQAENKIYGLIIDI